MTTARPRPKVVSLTDAAAARVKEIMSDAETGIIGVRVGVKNAGCAGMEYTMDYITEKSPIDEVVEDLRRTRARAALVGLAILAVVYFVARNLDLRLTAALFQGFFAVVVIVLIVVFQEDLIFEQIGSWRRVRGQGPGETEIFDLLVIWPQ